MADRPKHLVLDDDVHRALAKRKGDTGLHIRDIGNCLLRTILGERAVADVLRDKLIQSRILTDAQYEHLEREAISELRTEVRDVRSLLRHDGAETLATGSWQMAEVHRSSEGLYQIVYGHAKDAKRRAFPPHMHEGDEFLIALRGSVLASIAHRAEILVSPEAVWIPKQTVHSTAPLSADTVVVAILSPPDPAYTKSSARRDRTS